MVFATNLGFPRIGTNRELKKAVEAYWKGNSSEQELLQTGKDLRARHWALQKDAGLDHIPSNDFAFYDQVLDMICALGLIPERYGWNGDNVNLDTYFAMARGAQKDGMDVTAMEMTKWYDTNYHYIVPEFEAGLTPKLSSTKIFDEFAEAKAQGVNPRPVLIGPATFTFLGKSRSDDFDQREFVKTLLPVYNEILAKLAEMGAEWVQIDEPVFALDLCEYGTGTVENAYDGLQKPDGLKIMVATYFESLRDNANQAFKLPVDGIHIDLCRNVGQANTTANNATSDIDEALNKIGDKVLSLGIVDGRNIWKNDLSASLDIVERAVKELGADMQWMMRSKTGWPSRPKNWMKSSRLQKAQMMAVIRSPQNSPPVTPHKNRAKHPPAFTIAR